LLVSLKEGLREESDLALYAYAMGYGVGWDEAWILEIEGNSRCRQYKMACLTNLISQLSSDISPTLIPLISNEVYQLIRADQYDMTV
jgi:hypothetical protein